jgi:hypothetical protein
VADLDIQFGKLKDAIEADPLSGEVTCAF